MSFALPPYYSTKKITSRNSYYSSVLMLLPIVREPVSDIQWRYQPGNPTSYRSATIKFEFVKLGGGGCVSTALLYSCLDDLSINFNLTNHSVVFISLGEYSSQFTSSLILLLPSTTSFSVPLSFFSVLSVSSTSTFHNIHFFPSIFLSHLNNTCDPAPDDGVRRGGWRGSFFPSSFLEQSTRGGHGMGAGSGGLKKRCFVMRTHRIAEKFRLRSKRSEERGMERRPVSARKIRGQFPGISFHFPSMYLT